jgi:uncharacterized protein YjhX (UPF0386 family)
MDFSPGERAVLAQMRHLYTAAGRDQQIKALTNQWPPTHHETYRRAYAELVAKQLIHDTHGQSFRITDAGLKALGVTPVIPPSPSPRVHAAPARPVQVVAQAKPQAPGLMGFVRGILGRR